MHIAVLGAGAMGSWFGGLLAMHNAAPTNNAVPTNKVKLITTNQAHRDAINQNGLRVHAVNVEHTIDVEAVSPHGITISDDGKIDLILVLTKAFQTEAAMHSIASIISEDTHILSLQNGLGNAEAIASLVPLNRTWIGVSMMPVDKIAPGSVMSKGHGSSYFGNAARENNQPMAEQILDTFKHANIDLQHDANIHNRVWEKVAFNAGMNALCALSYGRPRTVGQSRGAKALAQNAAKEVAHVALSQQVTVNLDNVYDMIDLSCTKHGDHIPSMLQDLLSQRQTEVEAINGAVVKLGQSANIPTPLNDTLATLVRLAELSHQHYR